MKALDRFRKAHRTQALVAKIRTEREHKAAAQTAEKAIDSLARLLRELARKEPQSMNRAHAIILPVAGSRTVLVLVDPTTKDAVAELERLAADGSPSPLEELLAGRIQL